MITVTATSNYSVQTDSSIDTMYYPGRSQYYWLASPSATSPVGVMDVTSDDGGSVKTYAYANGRAFCPLVSLKSDVSLTLE